MCSASAKCTRCPGRCTGAAAGAPTVCYECGVPPNRPAPPIPPDEALRRILAALADVAPLPGERAPLGESLGRALAEDLVSPVSLPAFDAATMDGYALRAADARRAGTRL